MGIATDIIWTANIQTIRHVLEMRSDASSVEWEMLEVFGRQVGPAITKMYPALFQDFVQLTDDSWTTVARARALQCIQEHEHTHLVKPEYLDKAYTLSEQDKGASCSVPLAWVKQWAARLKGNQ